ncbi:MAG: LysE family translocator [Caulobacteraceae bacterium]
MTLPADPSLLGAFIGLMAVMAMTPGPAILFAVATGVKHGRAAVVRATAGMNAANLSWFGAAALGLTGVAAAFPKLFHLLRYAGAAYLVWLALRAFWGARQALEPQGGHIRQTGRPFRDGFLVQITNPKALLFFTAVLPPFLNPALPVPQQLTAYAVIMIGLDALAMLAYGFGGAALSARMTSPRFRQGFAIVTGILLLLAAMLIVLRG